MNSTVQEAKEAINTMEGAIEAAERTVNDFFNPTLDQDKQIPINFIREAKGLAFLTVIKAGFIWTGKLGAGLVIAKLPDGRWSAPSAIGTAGMGFGAELGGQLTDFMVILSSENAVKSFMQKKQFSAGTNIEFAAGPYGRALGANANISSTGIAPNYTYSHSKGLFGGIGLQGSAIAVRNDINKTFYGRDITPSEILTGGVDQPAAAAGLYNAIEKTISSNVTHDSIFRPISKGFNKSKLSPPEAAQGNDVATVYNKLLLIVDAIVGPAGAEEFKKKCKEYGQDRVSSDEFIYYLKNTFIREQLIEILPDILRLLQQEVKRQILWKLYQDIKLQQPTAVAVKGSVPSLF